MAMESLRIAAKESKIMKFILGGFILLAVGGLVFTDVRGFFSGGVANTDVAQVGGTDISLQEFDSELRRALQQAGMIAEDAYEAGLINSFLEGRINSVLKLKAAEELNLRLSNAMIASQIKTMFGTMPREQIEMIMRAQGLTEDMLAGSVRRDTLLGIVSSMPLSVANHVPSYIEEAEMRLARERRSGVIYSVPLQAYAEDISVTDDAIQAYYDANPQSFTIPEQRQFLIGTMSIDRVKKTVPPLTEEDLKAAYEERIDEYTVEETRQIAQANLDNPDNAQAVYELAMDGMPLKTALENVTGNDDGFRDTAAYTQDGLPDALAERAFDSNVKAGDITPPVRTVLGYTVMKVVDIEAPRQKPFTEVRETLKEELQETRVFDALYNKMLDTEDMIDGGRSFDYIAEQTDLAVDQSENLTQGSLMNTDQETLKTIIESSPATLDELFSLPEGAVTYPLELNDGSFAVVGIDSVKSAEIRPLEAVRDEIIKAIRTERQQEMATETLTAQLESGDDLTIPDTAQRESFSNLGRDSDNPRTNLVFQASKGGYAFEIDNNNAIIAHIDTIDFDDSESYAEKDTIRRRQAETLDSLLTRHYRNNTNININERLLERTYGTADSL